LYGEFCFLEILGNDHAFSGSEAIRFDDERKPKIPLANQCCRLTGGRGPSIAGSWDTMPSMNSFAKILLASSWAAAVGPDAESFFRIDRLSLGSGKFGPLP
jgi:hypothetical protein